MERGGDEDEKAEEDEVIELWRAPVDSRVGREEEGQGGAGIAGPLANRGHPAYCKYCDMIAVSSEPVEVQRCVSVRL
jgi:hypothetical protein